MPADDVKKGGSILTTFLLEGRLFFLALVSLVCITREYRGRGFYFPYWGGGFFFPRLLDNVRVELKGAFFIYIPGHRESLTQLILTALPLILFIYLFMSIRDRCDTILLSSIPPIAGFGRQKNALNQRCLFVRADREEDMRRTAGFLASQFCI